jgi:hypothetical protein
VEQVSDRTTAASHFTAVGWAASNWCWLTNNDYGSGAANDRGWLAATGLVAGFGAGCGESCHGEGDNAQNKKILHWMFLSWKRGLVNQGKVYRLGQ